MNRKIIARLGIFFIGLPLVLTIVFIQKYNHLMLHFLICIVCGISANEAYNIFSTKTKLYHRVFIIAESVFIPLIAAIYEVTPSFFSEIYLPGNNNEVITYAFIITVLFILFAEIAVAKKFDDSLARISSSIFIILYSGYMLTFVSRMTVMTRFGHNISTYVIAVFLLMVFLCDSFAWFFGVLLGKNNRGIIKASPNKSIAGFIGGFIGSITAGFIGYLYVPYVFIGSPIKIIILSICVAFSAIIGDLVESVFKRSASVKDSGHIIPGRGGLLDCVDSITLSAPIYYFLLSLFYGPLTILP
ncbi:MAG: phosphatidate cytidylyltransferase [Treponema sp.]|nr:phosphatidate cytidylyltransferase [Treponema sp.]